MTERGRERAAKAKSVLISVQGFANRGKTGGGLNWIDMVRERERKWWEDGYISVFKTHANLHFIRCIYSNAWFNSGELPFMTFALRGDRGRVLNTTVLWTNGRWNAEKEGGTKNWSEGPLQWHRRPNSSISYYINGWLQLQLLTVTPFPCPKGVTVADQESGNL